MTPRFRVWDGEEMHEPPHQYRLDGNGTLCTYASDSSKLVGACALFSTGVDDAKNTKIWEGDLIEDHEHLDVDIWVVTRSKFGFRLLQHNKKPSNLDAKSKPVVYLGHVSPYTKVIGNRYENSELLQAPA